MGKTFKLGKKYDYSVFYLIQFLLNFVYIRDITLEAPDTIKILVDPIKVAEKNDTILVLDLQHDSLFIKKFTIDGFFIQSCPYVPGKDSFLFCKAPIPPTAEIIKKADDLIARGYGTYVENQNWELMFVEEDSMIWLVCSSFLGDAGGLTIFGFNPSDSIWRVSGEVPWGGDYERETMRGIQTRRYLYVSPRYIYLIAGEFLW